MYYDEYENDLIDGVGFSDPSGNSALRAETKNNPKERFSLFFMQIILMFFMIVTQSNENRIFINKS